MNDLISRQAAIDLVRDVCDAIMSGCIRKCLTEKPKYKWAQI